MADEDHRSTRKGAVNEPSVLVQDDVIRLVEPGIRHESDFRSLRRRSNRFLTRWEPRRPPGDTPGSLVEFQRMLQKPRGDRSRRIFCERIRDGRIIGQVGILDAMKGPPITVVISYWIGRPFVRRGHGTRMVALAMDHAFQSLGVERIRADIQPGNEASRRLARSLGLRMDGYSTQFREIDGERRDHEHWWIRRLDWRG